jgi:hypothetical protein
VQGYPPQRPRNGLGTATFVIVLLGALLAVIPATAGVGLLLCLVAIVPAFIACLRARRGRATNRRRSVAAVTLAPAFVVVAVVVGAATAPPTTGGAGRAAEAVAPHVVGPAAARGAAGAPQGTAGVAGSPEGPQAGAAPALAPPPAPAQARPRPQTPRAQPPRPAVVAAKPAEAPKPAAKPAVAAKPPPAAPKPPASSDGGCDEDTHYVNVSGNCVLRPVAAAVAPAGASARCKDGTYSSSQHRSGTCSRHGGVQEWLKDLPS